MCRGVPKELRDASHHAVARALARFAAGTRMTTASHEVGIGDGGRADVEIQSAGVTRLEVKTVAMASRSRQDRSWDAVAGDAERRAWERYGDDVRVLVVDVDSGVVNRSGREVLAWLQELRDDLGPRDPLDDVPVVAVVGCALAEAAAAEERHYAAQVARARAAHAQQPPPGPQASAPQPLAAGAVGPSGSSPWARPGGWGRGRGTPAGPGAASRAGWVPRGAPFGPPRPPAPEGAPPVVAGAPLVPLPPPLAPPLARPAIRGARALAPMMSF